MTQRLTHDFVTRFRGEDDAKLWSSFSRPDLNLIGQSARELLADVPPSFGSCAMLSATWVAYLRERYDVPAVAVAGDLILANVPVFVCERNLPDGKGTGLQDFGEWNGHCWIEVGGYVGDLSLFRSAYAVKPTHHLAQFVRSRFGEGRGAIVIPSSDLDEMGMQYRPKYVLTDPQVNALWAGLGYVLSNGG
jgi:hypothetical protein